MFPKIQPWHHHEPVVNPTLSTTITVSFPLCSPASASPSLSTRSPSCFLVLLELLLFLFHYMMLSGSIFLFNTNCFLSFPSCLFCYNPTPKHKLLPAIWKGSGITRTVLIRTSWHFLAKTCTYGNSIRKREGKRRGKEKVKEGHREGSRVWDGGIRKTEGGKRRQWADRRVRQGLSGWRSLIYIWEWLSNYSDMYKCYCL